MRTAPLKRWNKRSAQSSAAFSISSLYTQLLVLQPTPFCNIDCDYCYLPDRNNHDRMSMVTVAQAIDRLTYDKLVADHLTVLWHAGEPLAVPPDYYREAFDLIESRLSPICAVKHSIQTNGMLIDNRWCELFKDYNVQLGLSIDGPAIFHDRHRKSRSGKGTHASVMRGVELLKEHGIEFTVIAVVTADTLQAPKAFLEHFRDLGAKEVGVNFDEMEGVYSHSSLVGLEAEHRKFMSQLFEMSRIEQQCEWPRLREVDNAYSVLVNNLPSTTLGERTLPDTNLNIPFRIISVAYNGDFSTFSPELLGQKSVEYGDFSIGNVSYQSYLEVCTGGNFLHLFESIMTGVSLCESSCQYFKYCGGGAPANKYYENGTFESTETLYCRTMIQHPFEIVLGQLESELFIAE